MSTTDLQESIARMGAAARVHLLAHAQWLALQVGTEDEHGKPGLIDLLGRQVE